MKQIKGVLGIITPFVVSFAFFYYEFKRSGYDNLKYSPDRFHAEIIWFGLAILMAHILLNRKYLSFYKKLNISHLKLPLFTDIAVVPILIGGLFLLLYSVVFRTIIGPVVNQLPWVPVQALLSPSTSIYVYSYILNIYSLTFWLTAIVIAIIQNRKIAEIINKNSGLLSGQNGEELLKKIKHHTYFLFIRVFIFYIFVYFVLGIFSFFTYPPSF